MEDGMKGLRLGIAAAVLAIAAHTGAFACEGKTVLFQDNFQDLQPTWGEASDELSVANGQLVMKPEATYTNWLPNTAGLYDDIDMCVDVTTIQSVEADGSFGGVIFWYVDDQNFYAFDIDATGSAAVFRRQRGRWLKQVDWQKVDSLKPGDGAVNSVRVVTVGNQASFYLNGKLFKELRGAPPDNGQQIGFIASSPDKSPASFGFSKLDVTQPPKP
jgi:hypothetical protein